MTTPTPATPVRRPITDVAAWMAGLPADTQRTLTALGELLVGGSDHRQRSETADDFTRRVLGAVDPGALATEDADLTAATAIPVALALAEMIGEYADLAEIGPGRYLDPPAWTRTEIGADTVHHPQHLRVAFPLGTVDPDTAVVVRLQARATALDPADVEVYVDRDHQEVARAVVDRLLARANQLNPYRGRVLRAGGDGGLRFQVIDLPTALTRDTVIVDDAVWREIDLGLASVRDRYELLNDHGLGCRRGVLLVGPPGTGKSAVSGVIANEVVGGFTVIYVEARAGAALLTAVVETAQRLGGPVLLVLEDVDLWVRDRGRGSSGLAELLQAMDIDPDARILTLASTNDAATLDAAAIRTGRFDAIVEVSYPDRAAAARILTALLDGLPGGDTVDAVAVTARLPSATSGSDLREVVRRAMLSGDGNISTKTLLAEIGSGRYRATVPAGQYL